MLINEETTLALLLTYCIVRATVSGGALVWSIWVYRLPELRQVAIRNLCFEGLQILSLAVLFYAARIGVLAEIVDLLSRRGG